MSKALDSIRVAIRVRPLLKRENGYKVNWKVEDNTIFQLNDGKMVPNGAFTFDRIFDKDMATIDLYVDFAKSIVLSVMEGINGTLFAYGQTASGKTHTMSGDENSPGIIPHSLKEVFNYISETENREFLLRVSYMEIYNEVITDLLKPKHTNLKIHENAQKEVFVGDLTEQVVTSVEEIIHVMKLGERNRHFGCTNMNERSSRSHTIFRMVIESRETSNSIGGAEVDGAVKVSHLNLVDLAGSERASATGAEGIRLREGGFINKSLFALGNVINKLSEGESTFVPFRDSKLTRILQTSLGGNAKTSIICAITPASMDETLSTLQFASRAKTIKNRPEVNEVLDETTLLKRYRKEINVLKKQLEQFANTECMMELQTEKDKMEQQLLEQREEAAKQREKLRKLANFFCTAQPRETEKRQIKRNKRRWTVCPMEVQNQPALQLSLPSSFVQTNKRLKSNDKDGETTSLDSADFHTDRLDRFFCEMSEREEDIEEFVPNAKDVSIRRSGSLLVTVNNTSQEKRDSLAENVAVERIEELKLELRRMTDERDSALEERDAVRNDLSENISSSCEIQEDLVNTKQVLREKKQKIRELQERLDQAESRENLLDKKDDEKQATFNDMCLAKEDVEKKLAQTEHRAESLRAQLETEAAAKDEAAKECQRLHALTQELENKVDLLTVVQSELESVDMLQVELSMEQEKNGALEGELRKKKDDYEELCEQMKREVENSACFQRDLAAREEAVSQTNKKFDEAIENLKLLEEQNSKLRLQIEELSSEEREGERDSEAVLRQLQLRVKELEDENASLILKDRETEGKFVALQEDLARNSAVVVDLKSSMEELVKERDEIANEKAVEVSELKENIMQLTRKLTRLKRRASNHSSIQTNAELESSNPDLNSLVHDGMEDELTPQTKNDLTVSEDEADKIFEDVDGLLAENTKSIAFEELGETNSLLVEELEELKQELLRKSSTVHDLETKLSKMQSQRLEIVCRAEDESSNVLPNSDVELKERLELVEKELREVSETKKTLEEELSKAAAVSETLKKRHEDEMESLRNDFDEDLEKHKGEVDEKVFLIDELEVNLLEASEAKGSLLVELESSQDQLAKGTEEKLQLAAILEEKSNAIEKLEGLLKDNEEMVSNLQIELQEQLERKDKELEEVKITVDELNGLLSKQGNSGCDEQEESERATEELKEISREMAELQSQLEEALVSKETFLEESGQRMADLQRKFDEELEIKRGELEEKSGEIANLELQLEEALSCNDSLPVAQCKEQPIADPQKEFDGELERNGAEIKGKAEEIADMQKLLEETLTEKQAFHQQHEERVAELQRNFNEALERKDTELQAKSNEIERLNEQLEQERAAEEMRSGKDHAVGENCLGDTRAAFEDDFERMNAELQETSKTIEELQIELQEALSSKEELQKQHKDSTDQLQTKFRDELDQKKAVLEEQMAVVSELQEKLQHVTSSKEASSTDSFEDEIAQLRTTFDAELERNNAELEENSVLRKALEEKLEKLIESHETDIADLKSSFDEEIQRIHAAAEAEKCNVINELEESLNAAIAGRDLIQRNGDESAKLRQEHEVELQGKNEVINENNELITILEEQMMELKSAKEEALQEHDTHIASVRKELNDELEKLRTTVEEKSTLCAKLEESLNDAIAARDLMQQNGDEFAMLREELEVELQGKNDVINGKNELIATLEEQMMELKSAKEEALQEHDTHIASVRKELNDELEKLRTSIEEKSTLCAKLEEEKQAALSSRESLLREHEAYIAGLKDDFSAELKRLNAVVGENSSLVDHLEEKIVDKEIQYEEGLMDNEELRRKTDTLISEVEKVTADLIEKTARNKEIDSEFATALKTAGDLTEERNRLLGEYQSLEKELAESRIDSETKSKEITALEEKARDVDEAIRALTEEKNVAHDELLRKIERLERECEKLQEHVRELVDEKAGGTEKDGRISKLTKQVEQLTKDCEMFTAGKYCENCRDDGGKRRESLVFKSMLEDIKEEVTTENEDKKQDKLIDELSYTLMVTQEKLEQKEFVIDEKEIEILEKDTQVEHAEENARKSAEFAKMQEEKLTELCAQIEHHKLSDQNQGAVIEKLRRQLTQADNTNKEEQEKCCNLEKTVDKQRDEIEGYDRRVEELGAQKEKKMENLKGRNEYLEEEYERVMTIIDDMESEIEGYTKRIVQLEAEQTENNKIVHVKNRNEYLEEEYERVMKIIDEMEAEIEGYTKKIEELEAQKENKMVDKVDPGTKKLEAKIEKLISQNESFAKREMESAGSSLRLSQELSTLKRQNEKLEAELRRLRDLSLVNLEEELKKVRNELKTKELDLYHVTYENTKQLDSTKSRIRELEKDRANYSKKNNELRTEIRRLRSQDDEPTMDIMSKQQTFRRSDTVGVVGSVALFTLDAKVAKLEEENGELKQKIETLQQKNDTLNIMSTDLKQRHSQVSEKYYKLKEQCAKNADAAKSRDHPKPTEQKPFEPTQTNKKQESELLFSKNPTPWAAPSGKESYIVEKTERKPTDQKPSEPMQHTRKQESQLLFNKQSTPWAATSVKESHTVEKAEQKPTVPRQNKENLFPQDKPDACKTQ